MATRKPKPDPLHARPDGTPLRSAWLTKTFASGETAVRSLLDQSARTPGVGIFSQRNDVAGNLAVLEQLPRWRWPGGILPLAASLLQWHGDEALPWLAQELAAAPPKQRQGLVRLIASQASPAAQDVLASQLQWPEARAALTDSATRWPLDTLRRLLALNPPRGHPAADLLQRLLFDRPDWQAALQAQLDAEGDAAQARTLARLLAPTEQVTEARPDELPALLRTPPWAPGAERGVLPTLRVKPRELPATLDWAHWTGPNIEPRPITHYYSYDEVHRADFAEAPAALRELLATLDVLDERAEEVLAGAADDWRASQQIAVHKEEPARFERVLALLQRMQRLTAADARRLGALDELSVWLYPNSIAVLRQRHEVEADFIGLRREQPDLAAATPLRGEPARDRAAQALALLGVRPERIDAVLDTGRCSADALQPPPGPERHLYNHLSYLDDALALDLLQQQDLPGLRGNRDAYHYGVATAVRLLKRFGPEHILLLLMPLLSAPASESTYPLFDIIDWDGLAWALSSKGFAQRRLRAYAQRWLLAHPQTAARALIPCAFRHEAEEHAHARYHLDLLAKAGHADTLRAEAAAYGADVAAAVECLLSTPPETLLPVQLPRLPAWLNLLRLPRLLLAASGHAVPLAHMPDALMPLMISRGGHSYAGLDLLQAAVTPDSLARVMLDLFEQWLDNGMPPKERWIFELQGRLGDDANARALAPRIRAWRAGLDRVRAYEGLDALTQIGSDTALMLLTAFTEQKRYSDLQGRAAQALARIADERDLTLNELADRTVPTLGLDARGELHLDFGPRQFIARLDAELAPQIQTADGARLKALPKPNSKDDASAAKAASAEWREFKKQARLVASAQITRLENAMCEQRRWPAADFLRFFVHHPVLRTLCQRCVWAVFDAQDVWQQGFRVAEDLTLADVHDAPLMLPADARVGLPHPLEIPAAALADWGQLMADYAVLQAFEQLSREVFTLTPEQAARTDLPQYAGRRVGSGSLLGLETRGWKRGVGEDGLIDRFEKALPGGLSACLWLEDSEWFVAGPPPAADISQTLGSIDLHGPITPPDGAPTRPACWADLSLVILSEVLRDLERMVWHMR